MAFQYPTGIPVVQVSGSITTGFPIIGSNQTSIHKRHTGAGANANAYTVTSGKTFYLYGVSGISSNSQVDVFENDGTTRVLSVANGVGYQSAVIASPCPIAVYTSGQNVVMNGTAGAFFYLWGIEQ